MDGWQITNASWQSSGTAFGYQLHIGHALPSNLVVSFTVENGSFVGAGVVPNPPQQVTIASGSTISEVVTVSPSVGIGASSFTLASDLTPFTAWGGHIGVSSLEVSFDDTYCSNDNTLADILVAQITDAASCFELTASSLAGITTSVDVGGQSIGSFPATLTQALTGIDVLQLDNNNLIAIPAGAFANLDNLTVLDVYSNDLTAIPAGVYSNLPNLETLYLFDNDAPTIDENAFANLPALKNLRLQNQVITGGYPAGVFAGLSALEELYLDNTNISVVDAGWFTDLTSLTLLRLRNNAITSLPVGVFSTLTNMTELRLENNAIINLPSGVFSTLTNLNTLRLDSNVISSLDENIFDGLALTTLNLSGNALTALPKNLFVDHPNPATLTNFSLDGAVAENDGWEITDALWQRDLTTAFGYQLSIGHALPSDLTVSFTVTNGTVSGSVTASVTIVSGSTTSDVATVVPDAGVETVTLTSVLAPFDDWSGHIASSSITFSSVADPFCSNDNTLADLLAALLTGEGSNCTSLTENILQSHTGDLLLNDAEITSIDPVVTQALSGTQILRLNNNNLNAIPANAFANLALTELYLHENKISSIGAGAFTGLSALSTLTLNNNSITSLPLNLLSNLEDPSLLTSFDVTGNVVADGDGWEITNASWASDDSAFGYQFSIGHALPADLSVSYTVTDGTVSGSATGTVTISSGDTSSNVITIVPDANVIMVTLTSVLAPFEDWSGHIDSTSITFNAVDDPYCASDSTLADAAALLIVGADTDCTDLTADNLALHTADLLLNGTSITSIDPNVTQALSSLAGVLRLNDNNLTGIPAGSFANLASLRELYFYGNEIVSVGANAFANMSSLERIALRDTNLTSVDANLYSNLASLERLYLHNNQVASIAPDAFTNLPSLQLLDLYNNSISELPEGIFDGLTASQIDLSDNNLTDLPLNLLANHDDPSSITLFDITGNPAAVLNDGNGWEITDAIWQSSGLATEYSCEYRSCVTI